MPSVAARAVGGSPGLTISWHGQPGQSKAADKTGESHRHRRNEMSARKARIQPHVRDSFLKEIKMLCPLKVTFDPKDKLTGELECDLGQCAWWVERGTRTDGSKAGCCAVLAISSTLETLELNYSRNF